MSEYLSNIGLEIHIQLDTRSKAFCQCPTSFGAEPNSQVCPVCLGYPGVLPSLNGEAMFMAYKVARALNCRLSERSFFDRKNYFYPDMPKNYQISQFHAPVGVEGFLDFPFAESSHRARIHDVHLEEDAGKMIHAGGVSLLDFNRAGTPLLEIVTEPDLRGPEQTEAFILYFRRFVRYLQVSSGNMEEGSLRCDANISLRRPGQDLGTKVEVKNLNSSRFVKLALGYEQERQSKILARGGSVLQETRLWNENRDLTLLMRSKEEAQDYRYFPEPDLPPFRPDRKFLERVDAEIPELPLDRQLRFVEDYGLNSEAASFLTEEKERADFFERTVEAGASPTECARRLAGDVSRILNRKRLSLADSALTPRRLAELLEMLDSGRIHDKIAKKVLPLIFEEDKSPGTIVAERNLQQITSEAQIRTLIRGILDEEPAAAQAAAAEETKIIGYFMGRLMQRSGALAEPRLSRTILEQELKER